MKRRTGREGYKNKEMKQLRNKMVVDLVLTLSVITLHINVLNQHYPIQLSEMIEIFYVYAVWYSSPQFHVSAERLNVSNAIEKLNFKFYSV